MKQNFVRFGRLRLAGVLHQPIEDTTACVITCHGFRSSKDSSKYVFIARRLCEEGFAVLRFDFRGCGESVGEFEQSTITGRIDDLKSALDFVDRHKFESVGTMGSSLGGSISILTAAKDERIKALVTWATPHILFSRNTNALDKIEENAKKHDVIRAVEDLRNPILIIHGSVDNQVPVSDACKLYDKAKEPKSIRIFKGADHRFTNPSHRKKAVELTLDWFKKWL